MPIERCAIVITGASGDLAHKKLIPALNALYSRNEICDSCIVVGTGRKPFSDEEFRSSFHVSEKFARRIYYHQFIFGLKDFIRSKGDFSRIVIFFALPPIAYGTTARNLYEEGFRNGVSIVIEKPFGYDLQSAKKLDKELSSCFNESQIFRIDHYLAKEAVQNIMVFRFSNPLFYPVWNSRFIESIQINAVEQATITQRGAYFDSAGIIRDMIQNHLLQLLALLTMEAPVSLNAEDIRIQKINLLKTVSIEECFRYQYEGYKLENGVDSDSDTETLAEMKLKINNFRWATTPVYIRTGKAVHRTGTEIGVKFKEVPKILYNEKGKLDQNKVIFKIQPAEGIVVDISTRAPGTESEINRSFMNYCMRDNYSGFIPEAYQRLLMDVLKGDHTLFVSAAETEVSWQLLDNILDKGELTLYKKGSLPAGKTDASWIDFDKYSNLCMY